MGHRDRGAATAGGPSVFVLLERRSAAALEGAVSPGKELDEGEDAEQPGAVDLAA